jgi:hypothetical protein
MRASPLRGKKLGNNPKPAPYEADLVPGGWKICMNRLKDEACKDAGREIVDVAALARVGPAGISRRSACGR